MSFKEILLSFKDKTVAITHAGKSLQYKEIYRFSELIRKKIKDRCLVFCLCQNEIESLSGYISFIANRIIPLLLEGSIDKSLLDNLITIYRPEYLWIPNFRLSELAENTVVMRSEEYSLIRSKFNNHYRLHDELALLLTTSGSTGSPKLVRISYNNIISNAESIAQYLSITENERPITALPMSYSFGLSIINSHFIKGATLLLTSKSLMEKEFWSFLKNKKATSLSGVPYTFEILKKLRFFRMDLPSLLTLTQAGGKLSIELHKEFAEYAQLNNKRFFVMYGQTEATARMSYLDYRFALNKIGSMGKPIPGGEFFLIDENHKIVDGVDKIGELVYKGGNVSLGYAECGEDLYKGDENKGVLYTGDIAKKDAEGFYYIVGRKKRFIKLFGNRVNLDEMERLVKNVVSECACVGTDDFLVIYLTDNSKKTQVKEYISQISGINPNAFIIKQIAEIPKNSSGKTIYSNLAIN
jgi:acyl-coenzyme A synthetase/AMP-(fatty) acid ligase